MSVLLDTNIVIDILRQNRKAIGYVGAMRTKPSISVVSIMELYAGARSRNEETRIGQLGQRSHVLLVTPEIARNAGYNIKHYKPSHGLDDIDALIAATAEHHGLALATLNIKHFPMFAKLKAPY